MSDGTTDEAIVQALAAKLPQYGLVPFHVRRQSDGFVFNRIWAAIKRECLMVVAEGVAPPEDVDHMWQLFVAAGVPPFRLRDRVGLDVVLDIEEHYAAVRPGPGKPAHPAPRLHRAGPARGQVRTRLLRRIQLRRMGRKGSR
jgi:3-hydroxybutyryl-CoA dehydrogenase